MGSRSQSGELTLVFLLLPDSLSLCTLHPSCSLSNRQFWCHRRQRRTRLRGLLGPIYATANADSRNLPHKSHGDFVPNGEEGVCSVREDADARDFVQAFCANSRKAPLFSAAAQRLCFEEDQGTWKVRK